MSFISRGSVENYLDKPHQQRGQAIAPNKKQGEAVVDNQDHLDAKNQSTAEPNDGPNNLPESVLDPGDVYLKIENLSDQCSLLSGQNKVLMDKNEELSRLLQRCKENIRLLVADQDARLSQTEALNNSLKKDLEQAKFQIEKNISIPNRNSIVTRQSAKLSNYVKKAIKKKEGNRKNYEFLYTAGKSVIVSLVSGIKRKRHQIEQLKINNHALQKNVEELEQKVDHNDVQMGWMLPILTQKTELIEEHEATIEKHVEQIGNQDRLIVSLGRNVHERNQRIAAQEAELEQTKSNLDDIRTELHLQQEENEQLVDDFLDYENIIDDLEEIIDRRDEDIRGFEEFAVSNDNIIAELLLENWEQSDRLRFWIDKIPKSIQAYSNLKELNKSEVVIRDRAIRNLEEEAVALRETIKNLWARVMARDVIQDSGEDVGLHGENTKVEGVEETGDFLLLDSEKSELRSDGNTDKDDELSGKEDSGQ